MDKAKKIKELRESTGMNRKEFCEYFQIPYRTVSEWERDGRHAPDYVIRLLEYYIRMEKLMKRNEKRFPDEFCFQLSKEEFDNLKFQFGTSSSEKNGHGGRRKLPYVYTEQGIAMLSAVLRSDIAIQVSIRIMKTFVEMRKYMANASLLYQKMNAMEVRQIAFEEKTDARFEKVFDYIASHEESNQKIFFEGQVYDAFSLLSNLISKAQKSIILIDGYVDLRAVSSVDGEAYNCIS